MKVLTGRIKLLSIGHYYAVFNIVDDSGNSVMCTCEDNELCYNRIRNGAEVLAICDDDGKVTDIKPFV